MQVYELLVAVNLQKHVSASFLALHGVTFCRELLVPDRQLPVTSGKGMDLQQ